MLIHELEILLQSSPSESFKCKVDMSWRSSVAIKIVALGWKETVRRAGVLHSSCVSESSGNQNQKVFEHLSLHKQISKQANSRQKFCPDGFKAAHVDYSLSGMKFSATLTRSCLRALLQLWMPYLRSHKENWKHVYRRPGKCKVMWDPKREHYICSQYL